MQRVESTTCYSQLLVSQRSGGNRDDLEDSPVQTMFRQIAPLRYLRDIDHAINVLQSLISVSNLYTFPFYKSDQRHP